MSSDPQDFLVVAADIDSKIEGALVGAEAGLISGWAWQPAAPDRAVEIEIFGAGLHLGSTIANLADALQPAAVTGPHAFRVAVDPKGLEPPYSIRARVAGSHAEIDGQIDVHTPKSHHDAFSSVRGTVVGVSEGCVVGWAVGKVPAASAVGIDVVCDGRLVARGLANAETPATDRGLAGHGFRLPIPGSLLDGGVHSLSVRIADTSVELDGSPLSICLASTDGLLARLDRLETGMRRLETALDAHKRLATEAYEKTGRALARRFDATHLVQRDAFERELSTLRHFLVEDHPSVTLVRTETPAGKMLLDDGMIGWGWDGVEIDAGTPFRWMGKSAALVLDFNEHAAAVLTVHFYLMLDREHASTLRISVNDVETIDRHVDEVDGRFVLRASVPPAAFRGRFCAMIAFEAAFTNRPSEGDQRELSVAVASVRLERAAERAAHR